MSSEKPKTRGLGRGLSALMADVAPVDDAPATASSTNKLPIERISPNMDQPRRSFNEDDLKDLAASLRERGVLQPLIVRPDPRNAGDYQIVAGERRWRAAQLAQLHDVPVIIREYSDEEMLEVAIIENIQREDLNPVEEARGYQQLMSRFNHTQEQLAEGMGKSRSYLANSMRLLQLPDDVLDLLASGKLSTGHARALITSDDPSALAKQVVAKGLSVRQTEALGKSKPTPKERVPQPRTEKDADTKALEDDLSAQLKMKVAIDHAAGTEAGKISISYKTLEELDDICRMLSGV